MPQRSTIVAIVIAFVLALTLRIFVINTLVIESTSMTPTLFEGDMVLLVKCIPPKIGDVVVFKKPEGEMQKIPKLLVKRISGKGNLDTKSWIMLGDNPTSSTDSRTFGAIPNHSIIGKVIFIYYPLQHIGFPKPPPPIQEIGTTLL